MGKTLESLSPSPGAKKKRKRVGRGPGSGLGKTCGRGQKGQKSRSGKDLRRGFEGGQMPLQRRVPKRGFKNIFAVPVSVTNVGKIARHFSNGVVGPEELQAAGLVKRNAKRVKVLGEGTLERALTVRAHYFSATAREKIEKAGGKAEEIPLKQKREAHGDSTPVQKETEVKTDG
jgi:large subunit ribosomal protein L15